MTGRPTDHELRAAVRVARMSDLAGNSLADLQLSYRNAMTDGVHGSASLRGGQEILVRAGLLMSVGTALQPTSVIFEFARLEEDDAVSLLAQLLNDAEDSRQAIGDAGEEFLAALLRTELEQLGRVDLAARVSRVSLLTDTLGYDIQAPMLVDGILRRIEVKTHSAGADADTVRFFLSRNEYEVGRRNPLEWALVVCAIDRSTGAGSVIGWCCAGSLPAYLPDDRNGRWTEALLKLPASALIEGYPPAV